MRPSIFPEATRLSASFTERTGTVDSTGMVIPSASQRPTCSRSAGRDLTKTKSQRVEERAWQRGWPFGSIDLRPESVYQYLTGIGPSVGS